jgi:hypothetical protein
MADTNGSDAQVLGTIATDGPKSYASSKMVDGQLIQLIKEDQNFKWVSKSIAFIHWTRL